MVRSLAQVGIVRGFTYIRSREKPPKAGKLKRVSQPN
jgi:hypothetical protein